MIKRYQVLLLSLLVSGLVLVDLPETAPPSFAEDTSPMACSRCHSCDVPTAEDKCLKRCRWRHMTHVVTEHDISEAPDSIVLEVLADQFPPVQFDHGAHANMAEMGVECATCHHYSPEGRIPPCRECHRMESDSPNLRQPALKGAYHRQCMSCHREWSHQTQCAICHVSSREIATAGPDPTDIIGTSHPVISKPDKVVYQTSYDEGPIVTFYHDQHVALYDLACASCHREESCGNCHDLARAAQDGSHRCQASKHLHETCDRCHGEQRCDKCHDLQERGPFVHASTGWTLDDYHNDLSCRACHPTGQPIADLSTSCNSCHQGWHPENFNHAVVGLRLNEIHCTAACEDCHPQRAFQDPPTCTECHDANRDPRQFPPGEWL